MTTTIPQQDYGDLLTKVEQKSSKIDTTNTTDTDSLQLGTGYSYSLELRSRLELSIKCDRANDRFVTEYYDRSHPFEIVFQLNEQNCNGDTLISGGKSRFYGNELVPGNLWQENSQKLIASISIYVEPELLVYFWRQNKNIEINWHKLFISSEQPYFVCANSITPQMQIPLQKILNCPYQGAIARMYLESKVWELMSLQLTRIAEDKEKHQKYFLKKEDCDRLHLARTILRDRLDNPPSSKEEILQKFFVV